VLSLVAAVRRAKRSLRYRVTVPLLRLPPEGQALHPTPAELARDNPEVSVRSRGTIVAGRSAGLARDLIETGLS
jgi:hypothetical protein